MGILDRIILTIYTFALTFFSGAGLLVAFGWRAPFQVLVDAVESTRGRWSLGIIAAVLFISSVRLLYFAFRRGQASQTVVHQAELGEVRIKIDAIENLVRRVARQVKGIREAQPRVDASEGGIDVRIRVWVSPDVNIPEVTSELQQEISRYVHNVVGISVTQCEVDVTDITTETRRSRVE